MSGPNKDFCKCGKYGLDSFIGTYGDHESVHTRCECRMDSGAVIAAAPDELSALRLSLAQAQAREANLREALTLADAFIRQVTGVGASHTDAHKTGEAVGAALATPADDGALREIVTECYAQAFMAGMKSQQYVSGGYGVTEADLPSESEIIARVLGGAL